MLLPRTDFTQARLKGVKNGRGNELAGRSYLMEVVLFFLFFLPVHSSLGAFAKFTKKQLLVSSCPSICPSVCPHGTTQLPMNGF
jgi:hypothetical protein